MALQQKNQESLEMKALTGCQMSSKYSAGYTLMQARP
uniref:Uncharacterized protein n=1 Tax=Anguilla anguilla TaxID=7936 RepID=A0A0E9XMB7_ANGAN